MDLTGRAIAITGASSGIGEATALACARAGAAVALAARREDRIAALAARIEDEGGRAVALPTDVADERQARAFVEHAYEQLGGLDGLVNNAGVMLLGPVAGAPTEEWRRMVDVNVLGLLYCTHAALPVMLEAKAGDIVNVSSVAGRHAAAGAAVYNLTKFGVGAFSEALRQEVTTSGIRVTLVEPVDPGPGSGAGPRKQYSGTLAGVDGDNVLLAGKDGQPYSLPFSSIASAKLLLTDSLIASTAPLSTEGADSIQTVED